MVTQCMLAGDAISVHTDMENRQRQGMQARRCLS